MSTLWRSESRDCIQTKARIRLLCYFSRSCDRYSTPKGYSQTHTERVCYQRNKGQCTVSSHFQLTGPVLKGKAGAANKHPLFPRKQAGVCWLALGSDVIVMVQPVCDLWADDFSNGFIRRRTSTTAPVLFLCHTHIPPLPRHKHACIHLKSQK